MKKLIVLVLGIVMLGTIGGRAGQKTATTLANGATVLNVDGRILSSNPVLDPNYRNILDPASNLAKSSGFTEIPQNITQVWTDSFTLGGTQDVPLFVKVDGLGNSYVNGWRSVYPAPYDYARAVLRKFSPSGVPLWSIQTMQDTTASGWNQITTLSDNSVVWAWSGFINIDSTHIEKLSPTDGSLIWQTAIRGDVLLGSYGNTVIAVQCSYTSGRIFLLDSTGTIFRSFPTSNDSAGSAVTGNVTTRVWNGRLYLFAGRPGGVAISLSSYAACYDLASGSFLWRQDFVDLERLFGDVDIDGNVYAGGSLWTDDFPQFGNMRFVMKKFSPDGAPLWATGWFPKSNPDGNWENWGNGIAVSHQSSPGQRVVVLLGITERDTVDTGARLNYVLGRKASTGDSLFVMTWEYGTDAIVNGVNGGQFDSDNDLIVLGQEYRGSGPVWGYGHLHKFEGIVASVEVLPGLVPTSFILHQNYPNPFNPSTVIRFEVKKEVPVSLFIYSVTGARVATLLENERKASGVYEVSWNASQFASGIYFYRLIAGSFVETKKMVFLK